MAAARVRELRPTRIRRQTATTAHETLGRGRRDLYRQFDQETETIAAEWGRNPIMQVRLQQRGPFSASADGACLVAYNGGRLAYTKPRPGHPANLLIAREKIASDLAYELALPVAPVLIKPPCAMWPEHRAVSLICGAQSRTWGAGGDKHLDAAAGPLEALRALWAWIADVDHNGHPGNVLYEVSGNVVSVIAIDHANSLGHSLLGDPLAGGAVIGYGTQHHPASPAVRADLVAKIQAIPEGTIVSIVRRLRDILTGAEQDHILNLLKARQGAIVSLLAFEG